MHSPAIEFSGMQAVATTRAMTLLFGMPGLRGKGIVADPATVWRWVRDGSFPRPIKVGSRNAWIESEVDDYISQQMKQRDAQPRKENKPARRAK